MEELKPNGQRAKNAILLIWIVMAMEIISLISGYFQYDLLRNAANGIEITTEAAESNDTREQIIGIIYLVIFIISAITFIQWFRRAYYNLHLKTNDLTHEEGIAASCWFIPILNLYRPYQIMKELYNKTIELLTNKGLTNQKTNTTFLGFWWAIWIIDGIIGQFVFRFSLRAETLDDLNTVTIAGLIDNAVGIPLALLAIKVIHDYSKLEPLMDDLYDETDEAIYNSLLPAEES